MALDGAFKMRAAFDGDGFVDDIPLDPRGRRELIELLQSLTQTLIVSTHDLELARAAFPRSIVVDRGAIVADGSTSEILANRELLLAHGLA